MRIVSAIALLVVLSAFQNCADTGFGGTGMGSASQNSKFAVKDDGKKDPIGTTPAIEQNPTGEFAVTQIWTRYVCNLSGDMVCPAMYSMAQKISRELTLSLSANGAYVLRAKCFRENGQASFKRSNGNLYVSFKEYPFKTMEAEVGCDVVYNKDLIFQQALDLFHKSNQWIAKSVEGYKNTDALTDGQNHYLLMNKLKKVDPVVSDIFYVNGVEQIQNSICVDPQPVPVRPGTSAGSAIMPSKCSGGTVSYTPMYEKVIFKLSSDRKFSLTSACYTMTGSMPLTSAGSNGGFGIKVIVTSYQDNCQAKGQIQYGDSTLLAFDVIKGAVDYSVSATGDATHRIRDGKGRSLYMSKEYHPIYYAID